MRKPVPIHTRPAVTPDERKTTDIAQEALDYIVNSLGGAADLVIREVPVDTGELRAIVVYLGPMVDQEAVRRDLLIPLGRLRPDELVDEQALKKALPVAGLKTAQDADEAVRALMDGIVVILTPGNPWAYTADLRLVVSRQVNPPISEPSVRGPRDSFTEKITDNIALIRQRVKSRDFRVRELRIGRDTMTRVDVCYVEGRISSDVLSEIIHRLSAIDVAGLLDSSYLVPYLCLKSWSLFPLIASTERVDRACAGILQGRAVIVVDNSPFALVLPVQLLTFFQANEDYYNLSVHSLLLRAVRTIGWLGAVIAPGIYVTIASFNPGILPVAAVITVASSREGVPYPPIIEVLIMDLAMEMLAEASTRLPTYVGGAATVVGGLILGTAAAQAKVVSSVMIIVAALTATGTFLIPNYQNGLSWRIAKYFFTFMAAFMGMYGMATAGLILLTYLCSIDVLGVSYMSPFAPWRWKSIAKDTFVEVPQPISSELQEAQRQDEAEGTAGG